MSEQLLDDLAAGLTQFEQTLEAPQAPQLNPRPPDAEPARSAGGADAVGWGSAGASTPCDSIEGRVTTTSGNHARFWASVS